jgi:choline-sulfatase
MVSFYEPHSPFHFPVEYRGRHKTEEFVAPPVGPEDDGQIPAIFRDLTPTEKQGIAAACYTSVEFLDANVGHVLEALKQSGEDENTLVIYTGDHGYMLGQHGRFEKHCMYEPAIRAPLLMRYPGKVGPRTNTSAGAGILPRGASAVDAGNEPRPGARRKGAPAPGGSLY